MRMFRDSRSSLSLAQRHRVEEFAENYDQIPDILNVSTLGLLRVAFISILSYIIILFNFTLYSDTFIYVLLLSQ